MKRESRGLSDEDHYLASNVGQVVESIGRLDTHGQRIIVAIAGPPAAGKSTLATEVAAALGPEAALVRLDGFHFDDVVLRARGHLRRKGAPHSFDIDGYAAVLARLRADARRPVAVPVFDRGLELSRAAASVVEPEHTIVLTEGNWLLLDEDGWRDLRSLFDLAVLLTASENVIAQRIHDRWLAHGYSAAEAQGKAEVNDLPNARHALANSAGAELVLRTD